jgi:hypothetical protein
MGTDRAGWRRMRGTGAHRGARAVCGVVALVLLGLSVPAGRAPAARPAADETSVIGFDDYPANISGSRAADPVTDQYADQGVVFPDGVTALRFNDKSYPAAPQLPRSPDVVVTTCYAAEFCTNRITMSFTSAMQRVVVYVGSDAALDEPAAVILTGFDAQQKPVTRSTITLPAGDLVPATNELSLDEPAGRLHSAEVTWGTSGHGSLILDDLTVTRFVARVGLVPEPSQLELKPDTDAVTRALTITNSGNVTLGGLTASYVGQSRDTDPAADVTVSGTDCLDGLRPGQQCTISVTASPRHEGAVQGAIAFVARSLRSTTSQGATLLDVPVVVTVAPRPVPPTTAAPVPPGPTPSPRTTSSVPSASSAPVTPTGVVATTTPESPVTDLFQPLTGVLVLLLAGALGYFWASARTRRLRRRARSERTQAPPAGQGPRISVRRGREESVVDERNGPVLTFVVAARGPVTSITEEAP